MKVAVIRYNAGNIQSVLFALERIGIEANATDDPGLINSADKVIFPGVGEAGSAMKFLKEKKLDETIRNLQQPVLGICLGMQLLAKQSDENNTECLGIFDELIIKRFQGSEPGLKIPQIGWNTIKELRGPLFKNIPDQSHCYFVHGYCADKCEHTIAETDYLITYSSAIQKNNFYGVQFHPEKSAETGEQILKNFLSL
ncbi:MAG TPA: imidazole glycerol phosphate synthase subunit HisH [Chitinophagaceae bacterium]|nr:imidazole glycerol phosphate synthase subunit HisH [Chitinophagaceae bacterium]